MDQEASMQTPEALQAFINGDPLPEHGPLTSQSNALYVEEWWPAAVRLNAGVFFVRFSDEAPEPELAGQITAMLAARGLQNVGNQDEWRLVDGITLQWLGVMGAVWQVWAESRETAEAAIAKGVMDIDSTPQISE